MAAVVLPSSYYRVVGAAGLANLADGIRMVAFPLLAWHLTGNFFMVGLAGVAGEVPLVGFGLVAGKLADTVNRKRLLQWVTAARTVVLLVLAGLIVVDAVAFWMVLVAAVLLGMGEALADTATGAVVPSLVDP